MLKFGKSAGALLSQKADFFSDNDRLQAELSKIGAVYKQQPLRKTCKCCDAPLSGASFTKQEIAYTICDRCGHLSGAHEDTDAFCAAVYTAAGGADYAKTYTAQDREAYRSRVSGIYAPKAEFLGEALTEQGEDPASLRYADFGAGSGYFVAAMRDAGWTSSTGYEVSSVQTNLANQMIAPGAVVQHELDDTVSMAGEIEADVVSMIGVLEHVQHPRDILAALKRNPNVRYFFISIPLLSTSVVLESIFPKVFQRQLSAGHTHLFTEKSIDWVCREFGLERAAEWWFGTDMVDLFRSVLVELERNSETRDLSPMWRETIVPMIDDMQMLLDRRKLSSEVHMLLRFKD
ncbi:class I SAM-dependent methyltransferase [Hwanghaeella sp.]|uniref:class I SAM-dependent methyltransferase n=1 Tax=Hwanghaeella sp. TaxID=2605943 RepID=UPI003CCBF7D7